MWLSGGSLANSGTVLAQQQGTLGGSYILNNGMLQGANLTVNPGQLDNNGTLYTVQNLGITASQVNNGAAAKLLSQGNLTINAGTTGLQGQVTALGNLALTSQASFNQLATLAAGNTLSLTSQGDINVNGLMQGQGLQLSAAGALNNNGQLRAGYGESHLNAGQLNLNGAGSVQAGGTLRLTSRNGINNTGFVGTAGDLIASAGGTLLNSALLYAGNNMSLLANSIRNYRGDILAGNNLWMQRDAAGNANAEVVNTSGSIETQNGDISIRTGHLLNERDGLTESRSYQPGSDSSNNAMSLNVKVVDLGDGNWGFYQDFHGSTQGGSITSTVAPTQQGSKKRVLSGSTVLDVVASGGVSRIAAKKDLHIYANSLDNQASNLLAGNAIDLSGSVLNNQSYFGYAEDEYRVYKYTGRLATIVATPKTMKDIYNKRASKNRTVTYYLDGAPETLRRDTDQAFRSVIQAGGAVVANFSNNISNTSSAAYAGGYAPGRSAPGLNLATGPGVGAGSQAAGLNNSGNTLLSAPQATINLTGAGNGVGHVEDLADNSTKNNGLNAVDTRPQGVGDFGQSDDKQAGIKEQTTALINRNGPDGKPIELGGKDATFAGGVVDNSTASATTGAQAGKNAVENNAVSNWGALVPTATQQDASLALDLGGKGVTNDKITKAIEKSHIGPSIGDTAKIHGDVKGQIAGGYVAGGYMEGVLSEDKFAINSGVTKVIGWRADASVGLTFGPYPIKDFNPAYDYSGALSTGFVSFEGSVSKEGIGGSFRVGGGIGASFRQSENSNNQPELNGSGSSELISWPLKKD